MDVYGHRTVLAIGMAVGAYSSIFIATPFLVSLKEAQPEMKALRTRVLARRNQSAKASGGSTADAADDAPAGPSRRKPRSRR